MTQTEELAELPYAVELAWRRADCALKLVNTANKDGSGASPTEKSYMIKRWRHFVALRQAAYTNHGRKPPLDRSYYHDKLILEDNQDGWSPKYPFLTLQGKKTAIDKGQSLAAANKAAESGAFHAGTRLKLEQKRIKEEQAGAEKSVVNEREEKAESHPTKRGAVHQPAGSGTRRGKKQKK